MSELAAAYYQERAERLGIEHVPDILNGQPVLLSGDSPDQRLSLHQPNPGLMQEVTARYGSIVHSLDDFVLTAFQRVRPEVPFATNDCREDSNDHHINSMVKSYLLPKYRKAGRMTNVRVEAISRGEALAPHIKAARWRLDSPVTNVDDCPPETEGKLREDGEVYLLTTGALFAGRSLGYAACLTVVGTKLASYTEGGRGSAAVVAPKYVGISYRENEMLLNSAVAQSRAVRNVIDQWNLANPYLGPSEQPK